MKTTTLPPIVGNLLYPAGHSLVRRCALGVAAAMLTTSAQASFHLWNIREIYTDASGTLQFIELFDSSGGQPNVGGQSISVVNGAATQTHTFTLPAGSLSGSTFNHGLLFSTAGLQAAGGPVPDYVIPDNFLFPAGGTINFFGQGSGPYSALPTDGVLSRAWTGGDFSNTPQNFAGQTGFIVTPEPSALAMLGLGLGLWRRSRLKAR